MVNALLRVLSTKLMSTANIPGCKEKVYLDVSETLFKIHYGNKSLKNNVIKAIPNYPRSKTPERNTHSKVDSIKELSRLQSKEKKVPHA